MSQDDKANLSAHSGQDDENPFLNTDNPFTADAEGKKPKQKSKSKW